MKITWKTGAGVVLLGLGAVFAGNVLWGDEQPVEWHKPTFWDDPDTWNEKSLYDYTQHKKFMTTVDDALGSFKDIEIWAPRNSDNEEWQLVNGTYIPVTVDGKVPDVYEREMRSDRPMMLPIKVQGFKEGDGQSNPYTVVGRMPGTNPEVQWVFLVRKYYNKVQTDPTFTMAGDVAVIGHHPRTGASTYFQFYHPQEPKDVRVVKSPFSGEEGMYFWSPLVTNAEYFQCQRCHNADAFIHTPWIDQARVSAPTIDNPFPEPMVPSNPLGPLFFLDTANQLFEPWDGFLEHMDNPKSTCTECHRVTPYDGAGLYQNSTKFVGLDTDEYNEFGWGMHKNYQTKKFQPLPWMPPIDLSDFYAGQELTELIWNEKYKPDAEFINQLSTVGEAKVEDISVTPDFTAEQKVTLKKVPQPEQKYRSIMVDRPFTDEFPPNSQGVMIVDTRMQANTDGSLARWRFIESGTNDTARAAPVVFEKLPGDGSKIQYKIIYIGAARGKEDAGNWQDIENGEAFDLKLGQFLGLYLFSENEDGNATKGMVPYTIDDYLKVNGSDGTPQFPDGVVTHRSFVVGEPTFGETITFSDTNYLTYSFEMQNDL